MDPHADIDWERLDRWARAEGTPDELAALQRWIDADPDLRAIAQTMRTVGQPAAAFQSSWDTRGRWQRLQRQMRRTERPLRIARSGDASRELRPWELRPRPRRIWPAAAAALLLLTAGVSFWAMHAGRLGGTMFARLAPMREIMTRRGERTVVDLPDGSRIVIAPETRLRIPATYRPAAGPRDVFLDRGDVFFTVNHNESRPFRVHAGNGVAEDLGTEFMVTAYPDQQVRVVVVSGQVALWHAATGPASRQPLVTLGADQLGRLDSTGAATVSSSVSAAELVAWVDGTLLFNGTRLDEAVRTLGRWYDLDIQLADSTLGARRLTARIQHQSASQVLISVAVSLGLRIERHGKKVVLTAGRT